MFNVKGDNAAYVLWLLVSGSVACIIPEWVSEFGEVVLKWTSSMS